MKKYIGIALLVVLGFSSCQQAAQLFNPVIGTWELNVVGVVTRDVFQTDGTTTQTVTVGGIGVAKTGTWTSDGSLLTRTWSSPDSGSDVHAYSFNSDKSKMYLTPVPDGISVTFNRI